MVSKVSSRPIWPCGWQTFNLDCLKNSRVEASNSTWEFLPSLIHQTEAKRSAELSLRPNESEDYHIMNTFDLQPSNKTVNIFVRTFLILASTFTFSNFMYFIHVLTHCLFQHVELAIDLTFTIRIRILSHHDLFDQTEVSLGLIWNEAFNRNRNNWWISFAL